MPELPEVETTRRGVAPHILGRSVTQVDVRQASLRWPIPTDLSACLQGQRLISLTRRAKYLLFNFSQGCLLVHLGMSGSLRVLTEVITPAKHDHVDLVFDDSLTLRYADPRRFGAMLWLGQDPLNHPLLKNLGPEPLDNDFTGDYLFKLAKNRKVTIKQFIMDQKVVTGVGNIYANEALFASALRPNRPVGGIDLLSYQALAEHIKRILTVAIAQGGTTLRDFTNSEGKPGYFKQQLLVYGRVGQPCSQCQQTLEELRLNARSSVYCPTCQPA